MQFKLGGLSLGLLVALATSANAASIVYQNDFESGTPGTEWSPTSTDTTPGSIDRPADQFLGEFQSDSVSLTLSSLPPHGALRISFELFAIRSWDGNRSDSHGPDRWSVSVTNGPTLKDSTFSNVEDVGHPSHLQAYPGAFGNGAFLGHTGADEVNTLGYSPDNNGDSVYELEYVFIHTSDSVIFNFSGSLGNVAGAPDEAWGLNNVLVEALDPGVPTASAWSLCVLCISLGCAGTVLIARQRVRRARILLA